MKNKTTWILERYVFDEGDEEALIKEVKGQGCDVIELNPMSVDTLNPDTKTLDRCLEASREGATVFRGSLNAANIWAGKQDWYPGVIYTRQNFRCSKYYAYWGEYLVNSLYDFRLAAELLRYIRLGVFRPGTTLFLRPDWGNKNFTGGLFSLDSAERLLSGLGPDDMIIQAPPKVITAEYRFLIGVSSGVARIIGYSLYKGSSNVEGLERKVVDWVERTISGVGWHPDPLYVLDVGVTEPNSNIGVVELNSFSCSNLYGINLKDVVTAVNKQSNELYGEGLGM